MSKDNSGAETTQRIQTFTRLLSSFSKNTSRVKPVNIEEEICEGRTSVKMDIDDQPRPETGLLNSTDTNPIRITGRHLKSEKTEAQQKKLKKSYLIWFLLAALSEILGTAMLVFLACLSAVPNLGTALSHFQVSVVAGLAVYLSIMTFFHLSGGHVNPIVTVAAMIFKLVSIPAAVVYILAQFIGAILGYWGILLLVPKESLYKPGSNMNETHGHCANVPSLNVTMWQAFLGEFLATAMIIFVCCAAWDKKNASQHTSIPAKVGVVLFLVVAVLGPISSCGVNPARSFAPAIFTGIWKYHWIYWIAPLSASVITSYFYKFVFEKFSHPNEVVS